MHLYALGEAGLDIARRLAEADQLIAQADAHSGFTHAAQRHKDRLMAAEGRRLYNEAMSEAAYRLAETPEVVDVPDVSAAP